MAAAAGGLRPVHEAARLLDNPAGQPAADVRADYEALLAAMAVERDSSAPWRRRSTSSGA